MNGLVPLEFEINFNDLLMADSTGETRFVVGGRAYFEGLVFGTNTVSFTSRGFFDQLGYQEPSLPNVAMWVYLGIGVFALLCILFASI